MSFWHITPVWLWHLLLELCYSVFEGLSILAISWVGLRKSNVGKATLITPILLVAFSTYCFFPNVSLLNVVEFLDWLQLNVCLIWLGVFWLLHRAFGLCIKPRGATDRPERLSIGFLLMILTLVAVVLAMDAQLDHTLNARSDRPSSGQLSEMLIKFQTLSKPVLSGMGMFGTALFFVPGKRVKVLGLLISILSSSAGILLMLFSMSVSLFPSVNRLQTFWDEIGYAAAMELTRMVVIALGVYSMRLAGYSIAIGHEGTQKEVKSP